MDPISYRRFASFEYVDPENLLKEKGFLPTVELIQQGTFNGHRRKTVAEKYQAALFAYILGQNNQFRPAISVCIKEDDDFDCVIRAVKPNGEIDFRTVQLKEFSNRDPKNLEIQIEIDKLKKYSSGLLVVFWINRDVKIVFSKLDFSGLKIQQLWFMGETSAGEVVLHGGLIRDLISGWYRIRILKNGKVQTSKRFFKLCQPI
jgi:hypothetical protein